MTAWGASDKIMMTIHCGLRQLTVGSDKPRVTASEDFDNIRGTICADYDSWQWVLTRLERKRKKPLTRSGWLYMWILTADNGLWQDHGDSMWSLRPAQGNNRDNRPWVLTRSCECTSSLFQSVNSADLAYLITPCRAQPISLSPREQLVSTPK